MPTLTLTNTLTAGAVENINHVQTNFEDIVDVVNALDADNLADGAATLAKLATAVQEALIPSGTILATGRTTAPSGYLLCDGSAVSRTTYSALFTAISTAYGTGDGSTTFNVPDLRGRVVVGKRSTLSMGDNDGIAEASRSPNHTHTTNSHTHNITSHTHSVSGTTSGGSDAGFGYAAGSEPDPSPAGHTHTFSVTSGGSGQLTTGGQSDTGTSSNGPAYQVTQYMIKT